MFPHPSHVIVQWIIRVGSTKQGLHGQEDGSDLQGRCPFVLENVQADPSQFVNIRMVDLCDEPNLGGLQGVVEGEEELQFELAAYTGGNKIDFRVMGSRMMIPSYGLFSGPFISTLK